ncbi:MAG: DUF4157 domain-containing protein [Cyanobacteria bacterium J06635_10]
MGSEFVTRKSSVWGKKSDTKPSLFASRPFSEPTREDDKVSKKELPKDIPPPNFITAKMGFNAPQPVVQREEENSQEKESEQEADINLKSDVSGDDEENKVDLKADKSVNIPPPNYIFAKMGYKVPQPVIQREEDDSEEKESEQEADVNLKSDVSADDENKEENINLKPAAPTASKQTEDEDNESIQTKLTVGKPGDKYEQEADTTAAKVMGMSDEAVQRNLSPSPSPMMERGEEEQQEIQRKGDRQQQTQPSSSLESRLGSSKGGGSPLADDVRGFMEPRFDADFGNVRVHTDSSAVQMNKELGAQAFAHGNDIYYGAGKSPGNNELTAHELTHTIQQTGGLKLNKQVRRREKEEEDRKQLQTKKITTKAPDISLNKETSSTPQSEEEEQTLQAKELADQTPDISNKETSSAPQPQEEEQTLQAKELADQTPDISLNKETTSTQHSDNEEEEQTLQAKELADQTPDISLNKELRSPPSEKEETPLIQAKELPGETVVNKFSKGNTATGNFTSSPLSIQRALLSGIKGLAERGLGWIRSRVLAPMRGLAARGWSGVKSFGGRISTAYQQANPQIWDIFQPEHLMFRIVRNQRRQLFAQAIQAEQGQRAIATAGSQSGGIAPVNEPSQLQRLDGIARTIESGAETFFNIRKELLEGAVLGDYKENPTIWNTIGQIGMGFVPYAGQLADLRDLVASIQKLHKSGYKDPWQWFNLVLVGVGFIPGIGDAIKAGGRAAKGAIRRGLKTALTKADNLLRPVLGRAKGMLQGASRQGRRFMQWASRQGTRLRQGVRRFGQKAVNFARTAGQRARGVVSRIQGGVRGLLGSARQTASSFISRGRGLLGRAVGKFLGRAKSAFNGAKNRVSQAMSQVKSAMRRGRVIAQRVRSKVAQARQRATSLMRNLTQSAIQRGRSLVQSGRRFASQLRNKASQVGSNLAKGARQRVEGLVRNGVKFAKERAIPFIKQKLGGVKHRVKNFLQDRWNRLKERLGIKNTGKTGKEAAEGGAKEVDSRTIDGTKSDDYARGISNNKPKMNSETSSLDGRAISTDFRRDLSGVAQGLVRKLEKQGFVRVDSINPDDLALISKWFGKEIGVLQSPYHSGLRLVLGTEKGVLKKQIRPGEVFVTHTHPVFQSNKSHFGIDLNKAGKHTEAVVDWSGQITFFNKKGILNPIARDGTVKPMGADFQAAFLNAQGDIAGYAHIEVLVDNIKDITKTVAKVIE